MIVSHKEVSRNIAENTQFIISNKLGGFLLFSAKENITKYNGLFFSSGWDFYRTIEDIRLVGTETTGIKNKLWAFERQSQNAIENFFLYQNCMIYEVINFNGFVDVTLDCRKIYDFCDIGRIYNITVENGMLVVEYCKYKDATLKEIDYKIYLVIGGSSSYLKKGLWTQRNYKYDALRKSVPSLMYVYEALRLAVDGAECFVISFSNTKDEAVDACRSTLSEIKKIKNSLQGYYEGLTVGVKQKGEIGDAVRCCIKSVDDLNVSVNGDSGFFAGLPWFHQFWTRDSAVSSKALLITGRHTDAKETITNILSKILPDGRVPNRFPESQLASADGVGWAFKRAWEIIVFEESAGISDADFIDFVKEKLKYSINMLMKHHTSGGLAYNERLETWMDTDYKDDSRAGFRIEIQALQLAMYEIMAAICKKTGDTDYAVYKRMEDKMRAKVRQKFWKPPILFDGVDDSTIRPNIFLCCYIYQKLLSTDEWVDCFAYSLPRLWLEWGGIASIDKSHKFFIGEYTGEDNRSYHRGDSWFFINNLTAICLARIDKKRFEKEVSAILKASTEEILYKGAVGSHAEVSPAERLSSAGCFSQLWSAATYLELVHELF